MDKTLLLLVLGMGAVTYLPRMLPMVLLHNINLPRYWQRFLTFIPFAALGALIFPGIVESTESLGSGIFGLFVSILLAYFRANVIVVVFAAILAVFLWEAIA